MSSLRVPGNVYDVELGRELVAQASPPPGRPWTAALGPFVMRAELTDGRKFAAVSTSGFEPLFEQLRAFAARPA